MSARSTTAPSLSCLTEHFGSTLASELRGWLISPPDRLDKHPAVRREYEKRYVRETTAQSRMRVIADVLGADGVMGLKIGEDWVWFANVKNHDAPTIVHDGQAYRVTTPAALLKRASASR